MASTDVAYQPKDAVGQCLNSTLLVGGAGLMMSAVSNSLARENVGAMGIFTRTGSTVAAFGEHEEGSFLTARN